jgi:hypothetical protein
MKPVLCFFILGLAFLCRGQNQQPRPLDATASVLRAFDSHEIVMFGEAHGCQQEYEWLRDLVGTPEFADRVDDIVLEGGNSLYQQSVDRYIAGEDVPFQEVQRAWRDVIGELGAPSPVYESFYRAVRAANLRRPGEHQIRIVLGGPPGDWENIRNREELIPFLLDRDTFYSRKVREEVLAKGRRALLIMGGSHFRRIVSGVPGIHGVERDLRAAGASTWLIIFDTGIYDDPQHRFAAWPLPAIVDLRGNWVGDIPVFGDGYPDKSPTLGEAADAVLFIAHSRQELTVVSVPRSELEGTAYARELDRRLMMTNGRHLVLPEKAEKQLELP